MSLAIGFDLGGTTMAAALIDAKGQILVQNEGPTLAQAEVEEALEAIKTLIAPLVQQAQGEGLAGIGMGVAGLIEPHEGVVITSPNLPPWKDVPLARILSQTFACPVKIDNDVRAMALGELHFGAGQGCQEILCLTVGTGIGSALIFNGKIYRGAHHTAGELGHMAVLAQGGQKCGCGNFGCLETVAGTQSILNAAQAKLERGLCPLLKQKLQNEKLSPKLIAEAAQAGDMGCLEIWQEVGQWIGLALASMTNLLNPERIVIGGGIAQAGDLLFAPIRRTIQWRAFERPAQQVQVLPASLGPAAGLIGASVLARGEEN